MRPSRCWFAIAVGALIVASCSSSSHSTSGTTTASPPHVAFTVSTPVVSKPPAVGSINLPQPSPPLPPGYAEHEYFIGGTATSFRPTSTPSNGEWTVTPAKTAKYKTRVIARTPPAAKFSGTVLVEWFNVTALESSPDWAYTAQQIVRDGDAYIGVSAQAQGVEGGKTLLNVKINQKTASNLGASANKSGLKHIDPARYGTLVHPGDAYSYDIFSQIGKAVKSSPELLGGLTPKHVIAIGESQSAAFMTTLVDAVHPLDPVFDGFIIHSRGSGGAPLDGNLSGHTTQTFGTQGLLIRTDLTVPVFMFETETDLTLLGYSHAQQPDTNLIHTWEVAGTSHADAHLLRAVVGGPRDPGVGSLLGCSSINTGPQHEVLQAALHQVAAWVAGGAPPPTATRLQLVNASAKQASIARDANGNALGGIRNPLVDAPTTTLTGEPPKGMTTADVAKSGICLLFGKTIPFSQKKLVALYGNGDNYVAKFRAAANKAVAGGFLMQQDADELIGEAQTNRALFG
jgi:hypothetical protein